MRFLLFVLAVFAAAPAWAESVPVDSPRWQRSGDTQVVDYEGKRALFLRGRAQVILPDANFETGVIEFDMAVDRTRGFPGLVFRGVDGDNYENFYIRPHQSGNPDANQYTPVDHGDAAWQIFYGTEYSAPTVYRYNTWMHIRVEVAEDSARVYIDSATPSLVVPDLKRDRVAGFLGLTGGDLGSAYYANFSFERGAQPEAPRPVPANIPGLVQTWNVSAAMPEADALAAAAHNRLDALSWTPLHVETIGIANLARVDAPTTANPTTLARVTITSDRTRTVRMRFGFSDKVRVFLNGTLLYDGDDSYRSRDYRFLGTVGLYDAVPLALRRGRNEIVLAVSEDAGGGWAAAAAIDDLTGLVLLPAG